MRELEAIQSLGMATSPEVQELTGKSIQNTIKQLQSLEKFNEIVIIKFQRGCLYVKPEVFNYEFNFEEKK